MSKKPEAKPKQGAKAEKAPEKKPAAAKVAKDAAPPKAAPAAKPAAPAPAKVAAPAKAPKAAEKKPAAKPAVEKKAAPAVVEKKIEAVVKEPSGEKVPKKPKAEKKPPVKKVIKKKVAKPNQKKGKKKKHLYRFVIDCSHPTEDGIMEPTDFEQFLKERIKVLGKTGNLGKAVTVERLAGKNHIVVNADIAFSKRYLKYLTKKYLKKHNLRDWLRVVSSGPDKYELRYFQISNDADAEEEDKE